MRRNNHIARKLGLAFVVITAIVMSITFALHLRSVEAIRAATYTEMMNNVACYRQSLDDQFTRIGELQIEFSRIGSSPYSPAARA